MNNTQIIVAVLCLALILIEIFILVMTLIY